MKTYAKKESEMLIKVIPTPKDLHRHYQFWCYVCLIVTLCHSAGFPSFYSLINLIICIIVVCFWFHHYKIEEEIFAVVSYIFLFGATLYVFVAYFIFIEFIYIHNIPPFVLALIGVPYLQTNSSVYVLFNLYILLMMGVTGSIYQRMRRRILKMKALKDLKEKEKLLRNFGQAFAEKMGDENNPLILIADLMKKERKEKKREKRQKLEGTYQKYPSRAKIRPAKESRNLNELILSLSHQKKQKMQMKREKKEKKEKREQEEKKLSWFEQLRQVFMNFFYSASFSMHICRILLIVWILLYTSIPSFFLLIILFHSMLSRRGHVFLLILRYIYLPYVILLILYHHAFNSIVLLLPPDFYTSRNQYELWNYDLRVYRYPFLEFALQIATFYLICVRIHMGTQKKQNKVLPNESNWFIQLCFWFLNNMDTIVVIVTFFVGVNYADIYHLGLLVFFLTYILYNRCMRRTFFFFQLYVQLFALIHYLYVVLRFYYHSGSTFDQWLRFFGFGTSYDSTAQYWAFDPDVSQWVLIFLTFIQMRVYLNKQDDEELSNQNVAILSRHFYDTHPRFSACLHITGRYFQINTIWFTYAIFFLILVLDHKSLAQFIYLAIVLILLLIQVGGSFQTPFQNEIRLRRWWWILIVYSTVYLFVISAFQLVYSDDIDFSDKFASIIDSIPEAIKSSAEILGFYQLSRPIFVSLLGKVSFVLLGVHVHRYLDQLKKEEYKMSRRRIKYYRLKESGDNLEPLNNSDYSDSQYDELHSGLDQGESYEQNEEEKIDLKQYVPHRVDTQYFVFKCKVMWPVIDFICRFFFEFLALMVMMLSLAFRYAFAFWLCLIFLAVYKISVHVALYRANVLAIRQIQEHFTYNDLDIKIERRNDELIRLTHRSIAWALLMAVTGVMILFSYPSQFLYSLQANPAFANFSGALRESIWISFFIGDTYPKSTAASYFAYCWGYYFLLTLLVLERKAQTWIFGRYQVDQSFKLKRVRTTRQQILRKRQREEVQKKMTLLAKLENQTGHEHAKALKELQTLKLPTQKLPSIPSQKHDDKEEKDEMQIERKRMRQLMFDKYLVGIGRGVKGIFEHILIYLLVVACIVKANFFSLCYFLAVLIINSFVQNATKQMAIFTVIISVFLVLQYGLMLTNLNQLISPKTMPQQQWRPFPIPWYNRISGDEREALDWAYFFQLGNETLQMNGLWFEVVILFLMGIYFHYFCEKYYQITQAQLFCDSMEEIKKKSEHEKKEMNGFLKSLGLESLGQKKEDDSKPKQLLNILLKQRRTTHVELPHSKRNSQVKRRSVSDAAYGGPVEIELGSLSQQFERHREPQDFSRERLVRKNTIAHLIQSLSKPLASRKSILPDVEVKQIKQKLPIRTCFRSCRYLIFLFMQFFTLCIILTLSVSNSGFLTIVYTLFSLYYIYQARSFYEEGGAKNWSFPRILKYLIFPYIQLDLLAQLVYQIPFDFSYEQQNNPYSVTRIIGIFQMWYYNTDMKLVRLNDLIWSLILKALIYIIISIQLRIFHSNQYKEFIFKELYKARGDNKVRGISMAYTFNNMRLKTECEISEEKMKLVLNLDLLRQRLYEWNKINFQDRGFGGFRQPTLHDTDKVKRKRSETGGKMSASEQEQKAEDFMTIDLADEEAVRNAALEEASAGVKFYVWMYSNLTNPLLLQKGELLKKSKESLYKGRLKALSELEYILMTHYRQKTIFKRKMIEYEEEKRKIMEEEEKWAQEHRDALGLIDFDQQDTPRGTNLQGIKEEEEGGDEDRKEELKQIEQPPQPIQSRYVRRLNALQRPEMPKTEYKEKTNCPHMFRNYIYCLVTILAAHTDFICYLMMVVNHMVNANLISFVYPALILGYALFENPRPSALFWKIVLLYAQFVIFLKFVLRFSVWGLMSDTLDSYHDSYKLGIVFSYASSQKSFFSDIVVDTLTIMAILIHQFVLISLGVWNKREPEIESVTEAIKRLLELRRSEKKVQSIFNAIIRAAIGHDADEKREDVLHKRAQSDIVQMYEGRVQSDDSDEGSDDEDSLPEDAEALQEQDTRKMVRFYSDSNLNILDNAPDSQIHQWFNEMKALHHQNLSGWTRFLNSLEESVFSCGYMAQLFPKIRQEKPGQDFFAYMILPLFIAIIFVIFFYAKMAAQYSSNIAQTLSYNQFSAGMVLFVLFQIAHIVLERYLYLQQKSLILGAREIQKVEEDQQAEEESGSQSGRSKAPPSVAAYSRYSQDKGTRRQQTGTGASLSMLSSSKSSYGLMRNKSGSKGSDYFQSRDHDDEPGVYKHIEDKVTYIDRDFSQCWKLLVHWALILFIHFMFFWYYPINGNVALQGHMWCDQQASAVGCNEFQSNWALIIAYLLYLVYFIYSAIQIRTGHPEIRDVNSLTKKDSVINKWIFQGYLAIPFLWELRTITDWTFTKTALDLFQWFKFEDIYNTLFITKVTTKSYRAHKLGAKRALVFKIFQGGCMLLGLLLLIVAPMIIFSGLNPIAQNNNVTGAQITFRLQLNGTNSYTLFGNSHVSFIETFNDNTFDFLNFTQNPDLRAYPLGQLQVVETNESSDSNWEITPSNTKDVQKYLNQLDRANIAHNTLLISMDYQFERPEPAGKQAVVKSAPYAVNETNFNIVGELLKAFDPNICENRTIQLSRFYMPTIRLTSNVKPKVIWTDLWQDVTLKLTCLLHEVNVTNSNHTKQPIIDRYWNAYTDPTTTSSLKSNYVTASGGNGIVFFTASDKVTSQLIQYSVLTFYISIVLVVGRYLRGFFSKGAQQVILKEMPYPDDLLLICESVVSSRLENKLEREEELYYVLIDIMRSPEMIKAITKSSLRKQD